MYTALLFLQKHINKIPMLMSFYCSIEYFKVLSSYLSAKTLINLLYCQNRLLSFCSTMKFFVVFFMLLSLTSLLVNSYALRDESENQNPLLRRKLQEECHNQPCTRYF